jgi:hypothetical protein
MNRELWEETITYFTLIRHCPHRKRRLQKFIVVAGKSLPSCYQATIREYINRPIDTRVQHFFYCCVYLLPREHVHRAVA